MEPLQSHTDSNDAVWQAGERIEILLNASSVNGVAARRRAEELVRQASNLYGEGLAQVLRILDIVRVLEPPVRDALVAIDLVAGLLLIHGLHPHDLRTRVESALESVRPYLGTHGGDVELLDIDSDGTVRLRLCGSCDGCPSSSATLELAVESAVEAAAPEVTSIQVTSGTKTKAGGGSVIPVSALRSRLGGIEEHPPANYAEPHRPESPPRLNRLRSAGTARWSDTSPSPPIQLLRFTVRPQPASAYHGRCELLGVYLEVIEQPRRRPGKQTHSNVARANTEQFRLTIDIR